jgi:hypothetical protein
MDGKLAVVCPCRRLCDVFSDAQSSHDMPSIPKGLRKKRKEVRRSRHGSLERIVDDLAKGSKLFE